MNRRTEPITILMADDDPDDRQMVCDAFAASRVANDLRFVSNGEELMDYLLRRNHYCQPESAPRPSLILLDLNMPKKDGREALAEIKADPGLRNIRIVVMTTSKAEEDIASTYHLGAESFIVKPVTFAALVDVISTMGRYWLQIVELPSSGRETSMGEPQVEVLLVEDDEDDYVLVRDLFDALPGGYRLGRVADFESALAEIRCCRHDLYLVDYRLGEHTGLELLTAALQLGCKAPIIMLTGQRERDIDLQAMQAGAIDYLVKDQLDGERLERAMRYALQQKRHEETIRRVNQQLEERVQARTAELAHLNQTLQAEIAERKRAEAALREADMRKDQFLATLAHELRNPLSPLTAAVQLLGLDPNNLEQVRELTAIMTRQLEQLRRLVDDLLDVSRISQGKLRLRRERLELAEAVHAAIDVAQPIITAAQHQLVVSLSPAPLFVSGDKVRLSQAIGNLLINAAKYTPSGGRIELEAAAVDHAAVVVVRDNGIGIPAGMQDKIFEMFTQVDPSATRSQGGLGIGLTLVKTLAEMHGGEVSAASLGPGRGSAFQLRLPLVDSLPSGQGGAPPQHRPLPILRVLVVDDNESASYLLSRLLEMLGQTVRVAHSATEALAIVQEFLPNVVISDIAMPGISGYELAAQIHELALPQPPLLVALTGYGQESDRLESQLAGFHQHLTKPIGLAGLEQLLASAESTRALAAAGQGEPPSARLTDR